MTTQRRFALPLGGGPDLWENDSNVRPPHLLAQAGGVADQHLEEVIDVASVPPPSIAVSSNPTLHAECMARLDGCPECVVNAETPSSVYPDPPRGFIANYVCGDCGHAWTTSWMED